MEQKKFCAQNRKTQPAGIITVAHQYLRDNIVDELIFAISLKKLKKGDRYIAFAESMGINVRIIPDWELNYLMYSPDIATIQFEEFLGIYIIWPFSLHPGMKGKC